MEIVPLLVFTTLAGTAAGAYVVSSVCLASGCTQMAKGCFSWVFSLSCIVLLGVGLCGTLLHLGQPLRFANGMANPVSAISQESYWSIALGVFMLADFVVAKTKGKVVVVLRALGALAAVGLMVVTGLAYHACSAVYAWSDAITIPLFVVGDLVLGVALCMVFARDEGIARFVCGWNLVIGISWLGVVAGYVAHAWAIGCGVGSLVVGCVVGIFCLAFSAYALSRSSASLKIGNVACVLAVVGVVVVRGAFFFFGVA